TWTHLTTENGLPKPPLGKIDVSIAPSHPQRMYALIQTKDQGSVWRSDDGGSNWKVVSWDRNLIMRAGYYIATGAGTSMHVALPNGQLYHVASDDQVPYWIYGNRQDDGGWRISSDL